jgi:hypothetical protein
MTQFTYRLIYLLVSSSVALSVAVKMHRNGQLILKCANPDRADSATSINRATSLGFSLFLLGCIISFNGPPSGFATDPGMLLEMAVERFGAVFLVLGGVYLFHLYLISRIAAKSRSQSEVSNPA